MSPESKDPEMQSAEGEVQADPMESQKISCEECTHYSDCPRMKGKNFCYGNQRWLKEHGGTPSDPSQS